MKFNFLDSIIKFVPSIKKPDSPLSLKEKLKWTGLIMTIYFVLFNTPIFGVNEAQIQNSVLQLISIISASNIGSLMTVGIIPIVLSSLVLQLLQGAEIIKIDLTDPEQKGKFQSIQKLVAVSIAVVGSIVYAYVGYVPIISGFFVLVVLQMSLGAVIVIFLDETMVKYGVTSGINLFIAGGVAYSIINGTVRILIPGAATALSTGGGIPGAVLAIAPLFFTAVVLVISIYIYDIKVELPLAFSQFRGIGGRLPIPFLYTSVIPVIFATTLLLSFTVWFRFLAGVTGGLASLAHFIAYYQNINGVPTISGGLVYLISPSFQFSPLPAPVGSGYYAYINNLITGTSPLYLPFGGMVLVPELLHIVIYLVVFVLLCILFGKFWVEMTGQSPKNYASQLNEVGMHIPGFRRDPRIIENILNKYIPSITVLGSASVALLAALANLTGALGSGIGVLLTVGIMYMLYQQLEQDNLTQSIPVLDKLLS